MARIDYQQQPLGTFRASLPSLPSGQADARKEGGPYKGLPSELPTATDRSEVEARIPSERPTPNEDELIEDLAATRARLVRGLALLQQHRGTGAEEQIIERLVRVVSRDYAPQVAAIRAAVTLDDLRAMQVTLAERLDRGWDAPDSERVVELFADLLLRYEAVNDVIAGQSVDALLQRVQRWQTKESEA